MALAAAASVLDAASATGAANGRGVHTRFGLAAPADVTDDPAGIATPAGIAGVAASRRNSGSHEMFPTSGATWMPGIRGHWHDDIVVLTYGSSAQRVSALDGRTGATIWSRLVPGAYQLRLCECRPRSRGHPDLVVASITTDDSTVPAVYGEHDTDTVQLMSAATGHSIWRHEITGTYTSVGGETLGAWGGSVVWLAGILNQPGVDNVLVEFWAGDAAVTASPTTVTPVVLAGSDGKLRSVGTTVASGNATAAQDLMGSVGVTPAGDLDGDGSADYLVAAVNGDELAVNPQSVVDAYSGATGLRLWEQRFDSYDVWAVPDIHLTSDTQPDVLVSTDFGAHGGLVGGLAVGTFGDPQRVGSQTVWALRGATGQVLWRHAGIEAIPLRSPGHSGRDWVGVIGLSQSGEQASITELRPSGTEEWTREVYVGCHGAAAVSAYPLADVDQDGRQNIFFNHRCREGTSTVFLDPGGRMVHEPSADVPVPPLRLQTGVTTVFSKAITDRRLVLTARSARDGVALWSRTLPFGDLAQSLRYGRCLRGSDRQALVVSYARETRLSVLNGSDGALLWTKNVSK